MNTRVRKSWFVAELYKEIPPLFPLISKILETWLFLTFFSFQSQGAKLQKSFIHTNKSIVFIIIQQKNRVLLSAQHPLGRTSGMDSKKTKIFEKLSIMDRSSCPEVLCRKDVLKNFAKLTENHLCQSLLLIKLQTGGPQLY